MAFAGYSNAALSRIQLDHQTFVDRGRQIGACRKRLERAFHFLCVDLDPFRKAARFGRSDRALDAKLLLRPGRNFDGVARPHLVGRHVDALAVYEDAVVPHDLARLGAARTEPHAVRNGMQARFQQLQKTLARHAFAARGLCIGLAELALEESVYAAQLLLLPQLLAKIGHAAAAFLSVLPRRIAAALDRALVGEAFLALEEELLPLATALAALGIEISGHVYSFYMRRFFGGLQPLWGTGVTSAMLLILRPSALRARTADSRPGPGPLMRTSRFLTPHSWAARPACSAATWAANGVDFLEPLNPAAPEVAHAKVLPWSGSSFAQPAFGAAAVILTAALRGPFRVRALVRVRWPRTGSPLR